ncbi:MAG: GGDEF domain-containing protein [Elusimicrobia bacterium]|nr:GGDEF domain-containing protein [Elusimicrobiota bacterium]
MRHLIYFSPFILLLLYISYGYLAALSVFVITIIYFFLRMKLVGLAQVPLDSIVIFLDALLFYLVVKQKKKVERIKSVSNPELEGKRDKLEDLNSQITQLGKEETEKEKELNLTRSIYDFSRHLVSTFRKEDIIHELQTVVRDRFKIENFALFLKKDNDWVTHYFLKDDSLKDKFLPLLSESSKEIYGDENILYIPMRIGRKNLGGVVFSGKDLKKDKLIPLTLQLALGLNNAYLYEQVETLSRIDGLTGVFRRGYFEARLEEEIVRAIRFKSPLSLLMMDIDNFKRYNDKYGHLAGDQVLVRLAGILKQETYETDFICRYGGEEFSIIMPLTPPEAVKTLAENLKDEIEKTSFALVDNIEEKITVSIGLAHLPLNDNSKDTLLKASDAALYLAKSLGKNQVREYQEVIDGRSSS